jgi:DNA-binding transcriptional LysR family regulator
MDLRIRQLRCFAILAETLDYKTASASLRIPQSTVQFQIRGLEESFATQLFVRQEKKLALTDAGRTLLRATGRILAAVGELQDQMLNTTPSLHLNLCCSQAGQVSLLSALLYQLSEEHPELLTDVQTLMPDDRIQALLTGKIDLLMMVPPTRAPGVVFQHLVSERQCAIVPDTPRYRSMNSISIYEFARNPILLAREGECTYARRFTLAHLERFGIEAQTLDVPIHRSTLLAMVAAGRGVSFGVPMPLDGLQPRVLTLPFEEDLPKFPMGMAWRAHDTSEALTIARNALVDLTYDANMFTATEFPLYAQLPAVAEREFARRQAC